MTDVLTDLRAARAEMQLRLKLADATDMTRDDFDRLAVRLERAYLIIDNPEAHRLASDIVKSGRRVNIVVTITSHLTAS